MLDDTYSETPPQRSIEKTTELPPVLQKINRRNTILPNKIYKSNAQNESSQNPKFTKANEIASYNQKENLALLEISSLPIYMRV